MNDIERAKAAYKAITDFLDDSNLKYEARPNDNVVFVTITGEDFPVTLMFTVRAEAQRVETYSQIPIEIKSEKAVDVAMACAAINNRIAYGKFCLYFDRSVCTYENSEYIDGLEGFSSEYGRRIVATAYSIVEAYNDKIYAVNRGVLGVKELLASLKK